MDSFQELELDPLLLKGLNAAGFTKPFPIQAQAIGPLLAGGDVIGQARTGSGKTAAFGLPLLQSINTQNRRVQAMVLAPTRELAVQITSEIRKLGTYTGAKIVTIYGGQSINVQLEALRHGVHAVAGTPGRVIDLIKRGALELDLVKFVVLDEADTMLDMGFIDDIEFILDSMPARKQMSLFGATMPQRIIDLSREYMHNPQRILIDFYEPSVDELEQFYTVVKQGDKLQFLMELLAREKPSSSMIFCRTKYGTRKLARELERQSLNSVPLHGDLSQSQRDHSMYLFRSGRADVLVATDVASRGIDVPQVDCVVNFEVPQDPLLYFHRVGRTARAGNAGKSFTLVSPEELDDFGRIRGLTKAKISPLRPDDESRFSHVSRSYSDVRTHESRFRPRRSSSRRWASGGSRRRR